VVQSLAETPDAFFDWLEVRKASADFQKRSQRARRRMPERAMTELHYVLEIEPLDLGAK